MSDIFTLHHGDCLEVMRGMPDCSIDAIVTDPPYGLAFMGKRWDYDVPSEAIWAECLRVLKPGGHLLAFAGTRTQHRMAVRIEDAGFEIRDMIAWVYGSGFPKSLDVSKAIDKAAGAKRDVVGIGATRSSGMTGGGYIGGDGEPETRALTAPATDAARQWEGWGTAIKPALEPITVARKPLDGTVAANVLEHGTGALNIDACRVGDFKNTTPSGVDRRNARLAELGYRPSSYEMGEKVPNSPAGRWPANLIHDGSEEVVSLFPYSKSGSLTAAQQAHGGFAGTVNAYGKAATGGTGNYEANEGSAARFFYCAKASRRDRNEGCENIAERPLHWSSGDQNPGSFQSEGTKKAANNNHPTVKPTDLMRWLVRLVTPPGGTVLDPFTGSGSTGKAAVLEGFQFVGCELDADYIEIARARIKWAIDDVDVEPANDNDAVGAPAQCEPVQVGQSSIFDILGDAP